MTAPGPADGPVAPLDRTEPLPRAGRWEVAAVTERLRMEFQGRASADTVTRVVLQCARDVTAVPVEALPELVERAARQRLTDRERHPVAP